MTTLTPYADVASTKTELRAIDSSIRINKLCIYLHEIYDWVVFDSGSLLEDNNTTVFKPIDLTTEQPGRWVKTGSSISAFNVSLTGGNSYPKGTVLTSVTLNWTSNKSLSTQSFNNGIGTIDNALRTYIHTPVSISSNTSYILTATSTTGESITTNTDFIFLSRIYWGVYTNQTLNNLEILNKELKEDYLQERIFSCSNEYIKFAWPESYNSIIPRFRVNGLITTFESRTFNYTNDLGYTELYREYWSTYKQNGTGITVEVI